VKRLCIVIACVLALGAACGARALALTEYCPASAGVFTALGGGHADTLYSYDLLAEGARSVQGTVLVDTSSGWFKVEFPSTALTEWKFHYQGEYVTFSRSAYESAPLYVRFPTPVTIISFFVSDARSDGDQNFGWDEKGDVACSPPAGLETVQKFPPMPLPKVLNPRTDLAAPPAPDASIAIASPTTVPGSESCSQPFTAATVTKAAALSYPAEEQFRSVSAIAVVKVAVNGNGTLDDAWIYYPSGSRWFDQAAIDSARSSKYKGGTAFCEPANGLYLFRATFTPN